MKKIILQMQQFEAITKDQMKKIRGGDGDPCDDECGDGDPCPIPTDSCIKTEVYGGYCTDPSYVYLCFPSQGN